MRSTFLAPVRLDALDDLRALLPEAVHLHQLLRRMLQITVDHRHAFALGVLQPGENSGLLPKVPGKPHAAHTFAAMRNLLNLRPGGILGAVVHKNQLMGDPGRAQHTVDFPNRYGRHLLFIIGRNHNG